MALCYFNRKNSPNSAIFSPYDLFSSPYDFSADDDLYHNVEPIYLEKEPCNQNNMFRYIQVPLWKNKVNSYLKKICRRKMLLLFVVVMFIVLSQMMDINQLIQKPPYLETRSKVDIDELIELLRLPTEELQSLDLEYSDLPYDKFFWNKKLFDPRVAPALALFAIRKHIEENDILLPDFKLRFSWDDWCDLDGRLLPRVAWHMSNKQPLTCSSFKSAAGNGFFKTVISDTCQDLTEKERKSLKDHPYFPQFKITGFSDLRIPVEQRIIYGGSYLKHTMSAPERIIMLGVHPSGESISIQTVQENRNEREFRESGSHELENKYLDDCASDFEDAGNPRYISIKEQMKKLTSKFSGDKDVNQISEKNLIKDQTRIISTKFNHNKLDKSDLEWNFSLFLDDLKIQIKADYHNTGSSSMEDWLDYRLYRSVIDEYENHNGSYPKYFHEAKTLDSRGDHYDWRFFNAPNLSDYERRSALNKMAKAWSRFSKAANIQTWLAHGSLLGYYYNGMSLNWDTDLDVQVSMASLVMLARNYNQSLIVDTTVPDQDTIFSDTGLGTYFLDVGTSFFSRDHGNGNNAIDARFIDIHTGLYIDITALANSDNLELMTKKKEMEEFQKMVKYNNLNVDHLDVSSLYHCKNKHYYQGDEIFPLQTTVYEGVEAFVPRHFKRILEREYSTALDSPIFSGHTFRSNLRLWVPFDKCPKEDYSGELCKDMETITEFEITKQFTEQHAKQLGYLKENAVAVPAPRDFPTLRINDWFLRYGAEKLNY